MPRLQCEDNSRYYVSVAFGVGIRCVSDLTRLRYNPRDVEYVGPNQLGRLGREQNLAPLHDLAAEQLVCRLLGRRRERERLQPRRYLLACELCHRRSDSARVYVSRDESLLLRDGFGELVQLLLVLAPLQRLDAVDVQPVFELFYGHYGGPVVLTAYVYSEPRALASVWNLVDLLYQLRVQHRLEAVLEDAFVFLGEYLPVRAELMESVQIDVKAGQNRVVYRRRLGVPGRVILGGFPYVVEPAVLSGRRRRDYELCRTASRQRRRYRLHNLIQVAYEGGLVYRYASGNCPASEIGTVCGGRKRHDPRAIGEPDAIK